MVEENNKMIGEKGENLVFLLSLPRSGSTLLSLMLGNQQDIYCPPEPWILLTASEYFQLGNLGDMPYGREWAEIATIEFFFNAERRSEGTISSLLSKAIDKAHDDSRPLAQRIVTEAYSSCLQNGKKIFVDKTPRYYGILGLIDAFFPKSKKIVLLRNPLDVMASYKKLWGVSGDIFTREHVSVFTRDFCEGLFSITHYAATTSQNVMIIKYEDLVNETEQSLKQLCSFIGVDFSVEMSHFHDNVELMDEYKRSPMGDPNIRNVPKPVNCSSVDTWMTTLNFIDIQSLISVLGRDVFEQTGYLESCEKIESMGLHFPTEQEASQRRTVLLNTLRYGPREKLFSMMEVEADRAARLEVIHQRDATILELRKSLEVIEADRVARLEVIHQRDATIRELRKSLEVIEADRVARLEVIHQRDATIRELQKSLEICQVERTKKIEENLHIQDELFAMRSIRGFLAYKLGIN